MFHRASSASHSPSGRGALTAVRRNTWAVTAPSGGRPWLLLASPISMPFWSTPF